MSRCHSITGAALLCLLSCLAGAASAQPQFTEVLSVANVKISATRGGTSGDYTNDGWPDLFHPFALLTNDGHGGVFNNLAALPKRESGVAFGGGSVFGDYDNDSDLDLYVPLGDWGSGAYLHAPLLLRNDQGVFKEVTLEAGLTDALSTDNAIWLDYDRDGHLDLYTGNMNWSNPGTTRNKLYRNRGDGTFEDVTAAVGLDLQLSGAGGSNGGMAAADFNDDGWTDLYVGVFDARNRLFLGDPQGHFQDATTPVIGHPGEASGVAVGDVDNDGDLDICQSTGGATEAGFLLLSNQGEGKFAEVAESAGLAKLKTLYNLAVGLADLDNDGDLDLLVGSWGVGLVFFLNYGDGTFVEAPAGSGLPSSGGLSFMSFGDSDRDGFLDVSIDGDKVRLYRNQGNGNHYLRVELAGRQSNRNGIQARLIATAGDLRQTREILGGTGFYQDELVAHFGLGARTKVDRLEIRWPSGQIDLLADLPADQQIRVIEGQSGYQPVQPMRCTASPESLVTDTTASLSARIQLPLFDPGATITRVTADLSALGGPAEVILASEGVGAYRLGPVSLSVEGANELRRIPIASEQSTSLGSYWMHGSLLVGVLPRDLLLFGDGPAADWTWKAVLQANLDPAATAPVYQGDKAMTVQKQGTEPWRVSCTPAAPVNPFGYTALRFALYLGEATGQTLQVKLVGGPQLDLKERVDWTKKDWQVVDVPLNSLGAKATVAITGILFTGDLNLFSLDEVRLIAAVPPAPVPTVVLETYSPALPKGFLLEQNYPNPFNSETVISFALPQSEKVELALYNLAGQQVATLAQGKREAGVYTVRWDGKDEQGRALASGVYVYRLQAGAQEQTRKLLLLR